MAAMQRLTPNGVLSYSRLVLDPPGETLRLAGVMAEGLRRRGVANPALHVVIVKGSLWADTLVKNSPVYAEEVGALRAWAKERVDVLFDPFAQKRSTVRARASRQPGRRRAVLPGKPVRSVAADGDRPFFFNYEKWRNLVGGAEAFNDWFPLLRPSSRWSARWASACCWPHWASCCPCIASD